MVHNRLRHFLFTRHEVVVAQLRFSDDWFLFLEWILPASFSLAVIIMFVVEYFR